MKKALPFLLAVCLILTLLPMAARAEGEGSAGYAVDFGTGSWTVGGATVTADRSGVQTLSETDAVTLTGFNGETMEAAVSASDGFRTTLAVTGGSTSLSARNNAGTGGLPDALTFSVAEKSGGGGGGGGPQGPRSAVWKLTDGDGTAVRFAVGEGGVTSFPVGDDFDLRSFAVTVLKLDDTDYEDGVFKSGRWTDGEGRDPFEIRITDASANHLVLGVEFHGYDDGASSYPGFYFFGINLYNARYRGVTVTTGREPDMYDFTASRAVALETTTAAKPGEITVYYGEAAVGLASADGSYAVSSVEAGFEGFAVPGGAVSVSGASVSVNSNFYYEIPLKVTLSDGTVGYVLVRRIGIDITAAGDRYDGIENRYEGSSSAGFAAYHGAANQGALLEDAAGKKYSEANNLVATFYYAAADSCEMYEMIATITYRDGTAEVKTVTGYGETACLDENLKGGDYLLWSTADGGDADNPPVSVSVMAVKAGGSDASFAGAMLGSGAGVAKTGLEFGPLPGREK